MVNRQIDSLYVHIPFCNSICYYCDFSRCRYEYSLSERYLTHLYKELDLIKQDSFKTIYIGGGTPSCLSLEQLESLLNYLSRFKEVKEYTIEVNCESLTQNKAQIMKKNGINRVSMGVQSFDDVLLKNIGRKHTSKQVEQAIDCLVENGIDNISIDLIFGFHNQSLTDLINDLNKAVRLNIRHISIYDLEIYPSSKFGLEKYQKVDSETDFIMYQTIIDFLNAHGFKQYEISNFALDGYQSLHNKTYWYYDDYYGAGLSASGKIDHTRYQNTANFVDYLNDNYLYQQQRLSDDDLIFEALMMNLRLNEGIDLNRFDKKFNCNVLAKYAQAIEKNLHKGLLEIKNNHLKTTDQGIFVLNDILIDFYD
ncbi:MAG: radical SAM family heme chaperone HemW [Erysipelotrichaceae bacterium]